MKKYKIKTKIIICLTLILIVVVNFFSLARYYSSISTYATPDVAKWSNDIEILGEDTFILDNNKTNSKTLAFNLLSSSEVNSKADIKLENVPKNIKVKISNDSKEGSVLIKNNNVIVSIDGEEYDFLIPSNNLELTNGNITMTSTINNDSYLLEFKKNDEKMKIYVKISNNQNQVDLNFFNFVTINKGINQKILHTVEFTTEAIELPGLSELELYATFEQID